MAFLRWLILVLCLSPALPARAQDLPGLDDPAFRAAFDALLQADDAQALHDLHDLAARGNTAALIALPLALRWLPPQPDRADLRRIGPDRLQDLGRAAWPPAALWADGEMSPDPRQQIDRLLWLYDLGEVARADLLLNRLLNHGPLASPPPPGLPAPQGSALVTARLLLGWLSAGDRRALPLLQDLIDRDRIEGWMVLAELNRRVDLSAGPPIQANLRLPAAAAARLADGRAAQALLWHQRPPPPLPPEVLDMARRDLLPRAEFAPVRAFCAARCPASAAGCEMAFLSLLGAPHPSSTQATPLISLMPPETFFATPRGARVLLAPALTRRLGLDRKADAAALAAAHPAMATARDLDACFATQALAALDPLLSAR